LDIRFKSHRHQPSAARRNVYEVTEEWAFHSGHYGTREADVFLINGIPVLVIGCKNANKDEVIALGDGPETPELFVSQQLFTATEAIGFSCGMTWNTVRGNIFNWKLEGGHSCPPFGKKRGLENPHSFFDLHEECHSGQSYKNVIRGRVGPMEQSALPSDFGLFQVLPSFS